MYTMFLFPGVPYFEIYGCRRQHETPSRGTKNVPDTSELTLQAEFANAVWRAC